MKNELVLLFFVESRKCVVKFPLPLPTYHNSIIEKDATLGTHNSHLASYRLHYNYQIIPPEYSAYHTREICIFEIQLVFGMNNLLHWEKVNEKNKMINSEKY